MHELPQTPSQRDAAGASDGWSPVYIGLCVTVAVAPEILVRTQSDIAFLAFLTAPFLLLGGFFPLIFAAVHRRPKLFMSALTGMAIIASNFWTMPLLNRTIDDVAFWLHKPFFDKMVADQRAKTPADQPLRMTVEYEDRSVFVTASLFEYIIYDDTDQAEADLSSVTGYWPCPSSETGVISVDGNESGGRSIRHLTGHYYQLMAD